MALSYDPVDVLARFAATHGIRYPLLSDVGSRVIEQLGLLHEALTARLGLYPVRADHPRYQRVPYPGTFVIGDSGVVVDKVFEQHHLIRRSADWFISRPDAAGVAVHGGSGPVRVALSLSDATYRPTQRLMVRAEVWIAPGYHAYADPAPDGMTPFRLDLDAVPDVTIDHRVPQPQARTSDELGRPFPAYESGFEWPIGVVVAKNVGDVPLRAHVQVQACTASVCEPPESIDLTLVLHGTDHVPPNGGGST